MQITGSRTDWAARLGLRAPRIQSAMAGGATTPELTSGKGRWVERVTWWRLTGYLMAVAPLLFIVASIWIPSDLTRLESPDWKPAIILADESWTGGDIYEARYLYVRAGQIASWRADWHGLLAAACGMKKMDRGVGPFSNTRQTLVRAMVVAERRQSRAGISAVAKAFAAIGEPEAASMVLSRLRSDWPGEMEDSGDADGKGCWASDGSEHVYRVSP